MKNLIKYNNFTYSLYIRDLPAKSNIRLYQGDEMSISIQCINNDNAETPFNLSIVDEFNCWFSPWKESDEIYKAEESNFVLGQSDDAIQYDSDQGNPANTTKDELHIVDPNYDILKEFTGDRIQFDPQMIINNSIYTLIDFTAQITKEITKSE